MDNLDKTTTVIVLAEPEKEHWSDDFETQRACEYLALKDKNQTMQQIAEHFGWTSRQSMYGQLKRWEADGIMDKAVEAYNTPKREEITRTNERVLSQWPNIINRVIKIALTSRSDRNALEAAAWLHQHIVKPQLDDVSEGSDAQAIYANKRGMFRPMHITAPAFLEAGKED